MEQQGQFDFSIIKTLRMKRGLTAEQLAGAAGITRATVVKLESGKANPTVDTLSAVGQVFQMSAADLLHMAQTPGCEKSVNSPYQKKGLSGKHLKFAGFELFYLTASAGTQTEHRADTHQDTPEICMVISGQIQVRLKDMMVTLNGGEALRFKALQEHTFIVIKDTELILIHYNQS